MSDEMINALASDYWDAFNNGEICAYKIVFEELRTIERELRRKGYDEPKGFSTLKVFIIDCINDCEEQEHESEDKE